MWTLMEEFRTKEWQVKHSSLAKITKCEVTYEQCRKYACEDISSRLTHPVKIGDTFIIEIPKGVDFHFIGRVDTSRGGDVSSYYKDFEDRDFISFSTINNRNISRYRGQEFFVYDIFPEEIVHIFPMDSDTDKYAKSEEKLTCLPSLWLTLNDLESLTEELEVYNQITCKTKRNGQILRPFAVIAFGEMTEKTERLANEFGIDCIIVHPNEDAINYERDLLYDCWQLGSVSTKMEKLYEMSVSGLLYLD